MESTGSENKRKGCVAHGEKICRIFCVRNGRYEAQKKTLGIETALYSSIPGRIEQAISGLGHASQSGGTSLNVTSTLEQDRIWEVLVKYHVIQYKQAILPSDSVGRRICLTTRPTQMFQV